MCILFLHVSSNPGVDKYKLILASNRDEYFHRPTKEAHIWSQNPNIIGGQDMEPKKEGGTWLGISKIGKIGVLLNILTSDPLASDPTKLGRGFLVNDFLNSSDLNGHEYCEKLHDKADLYNPFNFVAIDLKNVSKPVPAVTYYSSKSLDGKPLELSCDNTYAFGNSVFESPFLKVQNGHQQMKDVVKSFGDVSQKQALINGLLAILKCNKQFSDPQMLLQAPDLDPNVLRNMSSAFTSVPSKKYGSRTHTVILIDNMDRVEFHEWTMDVDTTNTNETSWLHSEFQFSLK